MTVKELISVLELKDSDAMCVVSGYEGGICEVSDATDTKIELNVSTAWYYGPHEESENATIPAVRIG